MAKPGKGHNNKAELVEAEALEEKRELVKVELHTKELEDKLRENGEKWATIAEKRWKTIENLDEVRKRWLKKINQMEKDKLTDTQDYMLSLKGAEMAAAAEAKVIDSAIKHLFYQPEQINPGDSGIFVIRMEAVKDESKD